MNSHLLRLLTIVVFLLASAMSDLWAQDAPEPRLLVSEQRLQEIRQAAQQPGTTHADAFAAMRARVDNGFDAYMSGWGPKPREDYLNSWWAREAALVYLISGDRKYAEISLQALKKTPDAGTNQMGLHRAQLALGYGFAYDWAGAAWSAEDRKWALQRMNEALDRWPKFTHTNLGGDRGSNWAAITRGGELILLLAAREEKNRKERYDFLINDLRRHIRAAYGSLGYTQEGHGYKSFTAHFLYPAALVAEQVMGEAELADALRARKSWRMLMYSAAFAYASFDEYRQNFPIMPQTSVSNPMFTPEGWASVLWGFVSKEDQPFYKHFYDRLMGVESKLTPEFRYDYARAGATYALLLYPAGPLQSRDPADVWPAAVEDERGYYWYRNRWQDDQDTLGLIMADTNHHPRAWNNEEALSISLFSHGSLFLQGPGTGAKTEPTDWTAIIVDGKRPEKNQTGERVSFETNIDGAYIVVGGGAAYRAVGLDRIHRHLLVDFAARGNRAALFSTLDRFEAKQAREVTWHANLSHERGSQLKVEAMKEAGRPAFLVRGDGDAYLKGWILHPADAQVTADRNLAISTKAAKGDIWVVYLTGTGQPPTASITGEGLESRLLVDGATLHFDQSAEKVQVNGKPGAAGAQSQPPAAPAQAATPGSPAGYREWTSTDGRVINAQFISYADGQVTIRREDGQTFSADLGVFSNKDREYVQARVEQRLR